MSERQKERVERGRERESERGDQSEPVTDPSARLSQPIEARCFFQSPRKKRTPPFNWQKEGSINFTAINNFKPRCSPLPEAAFGLNMCFSLAKRHARYTCTVVLRSAGRENTQPWIFYEGCGDRPL